MKRFLALLLALTMTLSIAPAEVFAAPAEPDTSASADVTEQLPAYAVEPDQLPDSNDGEAVAPGETEAPPAVDEDVAPPANTVDPAEPADPVDPVLPAEPEVPGIETDGLPVIGGQLPAPEIPTGPSDSVILPFDYGIALMSIPVADNTYYAAAGSAQASLSDIYIPDEYRISSGYKRVFAVDDSGNIVASTDPAIADAASSSSATLYFVREPVAGEKFALKLYGGTVSDANAYDIGTLEIVADPIVTDVWFSTNFLTDSASCDISVTISGLKGEPDTDYLVTIIDDAGAVVASSGANGGGGFQYMQNYGSDNSTVILSYKLLRTAELDTSKVYSVKVSRIDGGVLYSTAKTASMTPEEHVAAMAIAAEAAGPVSIADVTIDTTNSALLVKLENFMADTDYNVAVYATTFTSYMTVTAKPNENGVITVPLTSWLGSEYGISPNMTYNVSVSGPNGSVSKAVYPSSVADSTFMTIMSMNSTYLYKSSSTEYTVATTGYNNAAKAIYEADNPTIELRKLNYSSTGTLTSSTRVGSFTISEKNVVHTYINNTIVDVYQFSGTVKPTAALSMTNTLSYALYYNNKLWSYVYGIYDSAPGTVGTAALTASGFNAVTGKVYSVAPDGSYNSFGSVGITKRVLWSVLGKIGIGFYAYGLNAGKLTVKVMDSEGNVVMTKESTGTATTGSTGFNHVVYFDKPASGLTTGEFYTITATDGTSVVNVADNVEYSGDKVIPIMSLNSYSSETGEFSVTASVNNFGISNDYYPRNYTIEDVQSNKFPIRRLSDGKVFDGSFVQKAEANGMPYLTYKTAEPLTFGMYNTGSYSSILIPSANAPRVSPGGTQVGDEINITGAKNFPTGTYTGYILYYNYSDRGYYWSKVPLTISDGSVKFTMTDLMKQFNGATMSLFIFCNEQLVTSTTFYYYQSSASTTPTPGPGTQLPYETIDATVYAVNRSVLSGNPNAIRGYSPLRSYSFVSSSAIAFMVTAADKYTSYRYATDENSLKSKSYSSLTQYKVNDFGDQYKAAQFNYDLSKEGWTNFYFQFKDSSGNESTVLPFSVLYVKSSADPKITSVAFPSSSLFQHDEVVLVPTNSAVPVVIHCNDPSIPANGIIYYVPVYKNGTPSSMYQVGISSVEKCQGHENCYTVLGYIYSLANVKALEDQYGEFTALRFYPAAGNTEALTNYYEVKASFDDTVPLEEKNLSIRISNSYINSKTKINGFGAFPGASVTVTFMGSGTHTVTVDADSDGMFVFTAPEAAEEGYYTVTATCTKDGVTRTTKNTYSFTIDNTAPKITNGTARINSDNPNNGEDGAIITWSDDDYNALITLKKIEGEAETTLIDGVRVGNRSYIDVEPVTLTTKYVIYAVDQAGNKSEEVIITFEDKEPPTSPTSLKVKERTTVMITLTWNAAKDNVGVEKYIITRTDDDGNDPHTFEVPGDTLEFKDEGLTMETYYRYSVVAVDYSGNESEPRTYRTQSARFGIGTASYTAGSNYMQVQASDTENMIISGVVNLYGNSTASLYDYSKIKVILQYRIKESGDEWSELETVEDPADPQNRLFTIDLTTLVDKPGSYEYQFIGTDMYGEVAYGYAISSYKRPYYFDILKDTTKPTFELIEPANGVGGTISVERELAIRAEAKDDVMVKDAIFYGYINDDEEPAAQWSFEVNSKVQRARWVFTPKELKGKVKTNDKLRIVLTAIDTSGNVSEPVTVTYTINADKPKPVTNLSVKERSNDIYLDWDRPEGYDVSKILEDAYTIYRSTSPDGPFEKIGTVWEWPRSSMMNTSYFTDSTIPEAGTYYYYVTAKNEVGNESDPSEIIEAKCALDYESPVITLFTPEDGAEQRKTVKLFASATDNYKLGQAVFEYQKVGDEKWTAIKTVKLEEADRDTVGSFSGDWDISKLEEGEYTVKVSVYDASAVDGSHKANAPAVKTATIKVLKYSAPVAPVLSVETTNSTATLTWTYSGDIDGVAKFEIYTCDTEKGEFKLFKTVAPSALSYEFSLDKNAYYNVKAVDVYGESAVSNTVNAVLKPTDSEKPVAVISPENDIIAAVGEPVKLSAELSSDNTGIVSYEWQFGDGLSSTGVNVTHTYTADNDYTVTLTVKDAAGNVGTADANVKVVDLSSNSEYLKLELTVVDGAVGASKTVPGAMLTFHTEDSTILDKTYTADENGKISVILKKAVYTVSCVASGYSQTTKTLNLVPYTGTFEQLFAISSGNLVSGELTAKEMTKEEIIEAGIDYSDPQNQQIDKFTVTLNFREGFDNKYEIVLGHKNKRTGEFTTGDPVYLKPRALEGDGDEAQGVWVYPVSEHFLLVIYGEAHWLKEMYQVDLMVLNGNQVEHLEDVKAELVLPDGLSFATMNAGSQSAEQYADIIGSSESKTFTWYVRGDKEGSYYLTANVNAVSVEGAASSDVSETYKTSEPIRVYAGSALQMTVTAPSLARRGEMYYVQIDLENVSDKPIYDLVFHIDGVEQYKVLDYKDDEKMILLDSTTKDLTVPAKVFNPGDKIRVTIGTNILFNGAVELIRYSKFSALLDPVYVLSLMSKASLEGSTTSIPCKCIIESVGKVGLLDGTIAEGIERYFGFEKLLGYKKDFDFTGSAIEVLGEIFDIPMVSEAMTTLELLDVESEYTYDVTIEHGTPGANTISGNVVEIESANTENSYIDASSGSMKLTSGGLNIKAVAPGEERVIIKAVPADPEKNEERTYEFNFIVTDGEIKSTVTAEPNGAETVYVDSAEAVKALEDLTEQALEEATDNPYEHFDSVYAIDSGADDAHVGLKAAEISAVMGRDFVTHIGIESENADVKLDRKVIEQLSGKDMAVDVVKLTEDEAASKFGETYKTSPTYEVTLKSSGAEVSELKGKAEIAIPYKFASGEDKNSIVVQHIDDGGNAEQLDFEYKDGSVVFETDSFSCFRITKLTDELPKNSPEITGDVFSGGKLKAAVEGAEDGDLVYKWYRGDNFDEPIYVGAEYTIQPEDSEQKLTVRAYGTGDPYSEDLYVSAEIEIPDLSETYIKGDVNNDGRVNLLDVNLVIDYISNGYSSEGMKVFIKPAAYINDDSAINVLDVNALIDLITS